MEQKLEKSNTFTFVGIAIGKVDESEVTISVIMNILKDIYSSSGNIPYDDFTNIVYNDTNFFNQTIRKEDFQEFTNNYIGHIRNSNVDDDKKDVYEKYLNKINRHVSLAIIQRSFIENISRDVENKIYTLKEEVDSATSKMKESEKELVQAKSDLELAAKNLSETKGSMYTEFIAILGIFSALIFVLFGGFDVVSSTLTEIAGNSSVSELIVFTCIVIVPLLVLIYGLLYWVGKLSNRKISSCKCGQEECQCSAFERHKAFFTMLQMITTLLLIGLLGTLLDELPIKQGVGIWFQGGALIILIGVMFRGIYKSVFKK